MPGVAIDGNDVVTVRTAVMEAVQRARNGEGPSLIVSDTYRYRGHSRSDRNLYRTDEEIEEWKSKDPIPRFIETAIQSDLLTEKEAETIKEQAYADIESARVFAESSPDPSVETIEEGVYAP
jgi:pyruvate dehydrogenase E1 component alpha subunit